MYPYQFYSGYIYYNGVKWRKVVWTNINIHTNSYISYLWLTTMAAVNGAQRQGIPRISSSFLNASKIFNDQSYLWLRSTAAVSGAQRPRPHRILRVSEGPSILVAWPTLNMVKNYRGRIWSEATKDCPDFLGLVQLRPWLERSDPEPLEVTGSHGKGRNVFLP